MTTPTPVPTSQLYVGIDIAAATFTVSWLRPDGRPSPATMASGRSTACRANWGSSGAGSTAGSSPGRFRQCVTR